MVKFRTDELRNIERLFRRYAAEKRVIQRLRGLRSAARVPAAIVPILQARSAKSKSCRTERSSIHHILTARRKARDTPPYASRCRISSSRLGWFRHQESR